MRTHHAYSSCPTLVAAERCRAQQGNRAVVSDLDCSSRRSVAGGRRYEAIGRRRSCESMEHCCHVIKIHHHQTEKKIKSIRQRTNINIIRLRPKINTIRLRTKINTIRLRRNITTIRLKTKINIIRLRTKLHTIRPRPKICTHRLRYSSVCKLCHMCNTVSVVF